MACFGKRNNLWQTQVRNKYVGSISKSFHFKPETHKWAKEQEVLMQWSGGTLPIHSSPRNTSSGSRMD